MFPPPRFVVVDDNPKHLKAILRAFQTLRAPCLGVVYDPEHELEKQSFEGVRVLFLDLHLTDLAATTDETRHFATIASILEKIISPSGGPFVLVVWTEHEDSIQNLVQYLNESLDSTKPYIHPLAITGLSKRQFISLETGKASEEQAKMLRGAVQGAVTNQPQLEALVSWEIDVHAATGATLSALMELVPNDQRDTSSYPSVLGEILGQLASGAVGQSHVEDNPRAAIVSAIAPILADRIVNRKRDEYSEVWQNAVTLGGGAPLDSVRAGKVNRMLHVAVAGSETIQPSDWGAVVEFPDVWWNKKELHRRFGVTMKQLLGDEFKIGRAGRDRCRPRLVRIGAACDYAQNRPGPLPYLLGLEIDDDIERKPDDTGTVRLPASEWTSPSLLLEADPPFVLAVNTRYLLSVTPDDAKDWQPVYRLREQLLMHLISHASSHQARPGIVELRSNLD